MIKNKFYGKYCCLQILIFCVYNVVQVEFSPKHDFFCFFCKNKNKLYKTGFFLNHQTFQTNNYLAIYKKIQFWYINPCENVKINLNG